MQFVNTTHKENYSIIQLDRGKVNALDINLVRELRTTVSELSEDKSVKGIILTGKPGYFSAGVDLIALYDYNRDQVYEFWSEFMALMMDLVRFPKISMAALSGHCPAGGTVLALTCDHRFLINFPRTVIGLNEVAVGIRIPAPIFDLYSFWLGRRVAYQALLKGHLFDPESAKNVGLVDDVYDEEDLMSRTEQRMQQLLKADFRVVQDAKRVMRKELIKKMSIDWEHDLRQRVEEMFDPTFRKGLESYIASMKGNE